MKEHDPFEILGIDYIELYVGNTKHAAQYFMNAFGFRELAYSGLETKKKHSVHRVLQQGSIRFVLSGALDETSPIARHVREHGDGIKDIALSVTDARAAYHAAIDRGAIPITPPKVARDEHGEVVFAAIGTYGETVHTLVQRQGYKGPFLPGYRKAKELLRPLWWRPVRLRCVDHIVGNVELGKMDHWADYYSRVLGFTNLTHFTDSQVSTEYTALMSKVMKDRTGLVKFPINEPAPAKRKSQVQEFLDFYGGPGVQHIALETSSIVRSVEELTERGVEFLSLPDAYYEEKRREFADIPGVNVNTLQRFGILADRDKDGYLLQIFTKPVVDRPTLFFEIIERHGSEGFGLGNFKALFEAIEREQAKRGTL